MIISTKDEFAELIFNNIKIPLGFDFEYFFESAIDFYKVSWEQSSRFKIFRHPTRFATLIKWNHFAYLNKDHFSIKYLPWKMVTEDYVYYKLK